MRRARRAIAPVAFAALALAFVSGCCRIIELSTGMSEPPAPEPDPAPPPASIDPNKPIVVTGAQVDLGMIVHPARRKTASPAMHAWTAQKLRPSTYKLGYALDAAEKQAIEDDLQKYARSVRYQPGKDGRFTWAPSKSCSADMRCVLERLAARSGASIEPIAERFKKRAKEGNLDSMQVASIVVGFIQTIRYEVPQDEPFGLLPPARVAYEKRGDCDSKALLGYMLLTSLGIRSVVISSQAHKHAMLGIALPVQGTSFTHDGSRYAFTETTARGSPIGHINPELLRPNDWRAVPIRIGEATGTAGGI